MSHNTFPSAAESHRAYESRLSPELQAYVRTPDFKAWFGDWEGDPENASRMVDENGEPQVFYSGLPAGITQLSGDQRLHTGSDEVGFYFTKRASNARGMASQRRDFITDEVAPSSVYGAFLNARHPYVVQKGDGVVTTHITEAPEGIDAYVNNKLQETVVFDPSQVVLISETPVNLPGDGPP